MTSIPLDQLGANAGAGDDGLRRDQWGRLLVVPPKAEKAEGYTRVTTVAKTLDEGGGLAPWKATMAVCGTMRRRGIHAKWEALISSTGDPWYHDEQSKAQCKRLVEEAAEAGGATDRREQGTALHAITAHVDRGFTPQHLSPQTEADVTAYVNTLAEYGIVIIPEMVEVTVVLDEHHVGGSFDRLVNVVGRDRPLIADLKTGADITYSGAAFAVQLAAYSRGEAIYEQGATPREDRRYPMPLVDQHEGLVIWLPAGEGRCELFSVDLDAGWQGFELSMEVREWRKRRNWTAPFSQWTPPTPASDVSQTTVTHTQTHRHDERTTEATVVEVRAWLQTRINICGAHSELSRHDLARSWPEGMPTLASSVEHTIEQLAAIESVLDGVEARHSVPFGESRPGRVVTRDEQIVDRLHATFPNSTTETEPFP